MRINLRNLIIQLRQEIVSTLVESTKSTRAFCAVLTLFYLISRKFIKIHQVLGQYEGQNFKNCLKLFMETQSTHSLGLLPGNLLVPTSIFGHSLHIALQENVQLLVSGFSLAVTKHYFEHEKENSIIMTIAGYTVILGSSRLLEPVWGQLEFGIFFGT